MALIPNNPRIGGFMGRMAVPGRPGVGNTGIVPPGLQQRPAEVVGMGTGGPLPPSVLNVQTGGPLPPTTKPAIQTGGTDPAYPREYQTGGNLPPMPVSTGPTLPDESGGPRPMDGSLNPTGGYGRQRPLGTSGGTTVPTTAQDYYAANGQMPTMPHNQLGGYGGGSAPPRPAQMPAAPMASGTTMPGLPRAPTLPTNSQMQLPATNAQGGRVARPMLTGRPAGGLFPRLG